MRRVPCSQEKMQGISRNRPFFPKICLEDVCKFSSLQGKFPTRKSREFICASRELFPPFGPEQGIWREIDPCARTGVAGGRFVRVEASIDSRGAGQLGGGPSR